MLVAWPGIKLGHKLWCMTARTRGATRIHPSLLSAAAASLALCACNITRLAVPAHPSGATDATASAALDGRPAVVTRRNGDEQSVAAARFEGEGDLLVGKAMTGDSPDPAWPHRIEWTRVPRDEVREVSTVDNGRGALKGLVVGSLAGFVPTTAVVFGFTQSVGCTRTPSAVPSSCSPPSMGTDVAVSALVGLCAAVITGGVGAWIGWATGDGAVVTVAPTDEGIATAKRAPLRF
jgi:hypothetical protein